MKVSIEQIKTRVKILDILNKERIYLIIECQCGKNFTRRKDYVDRLFRENRPISCGCSRIYPTKDEHHLWLGYHDISGLYFSSFKNKAKRQNIDFLISIEDVWNQYIKQNKLCNLTGLPIYFSKNRKTEQTASIDRIDSNKNYTIDNIQIVHKTVNLMKNAIPQDIFIQLCKHIAENN